MLAAARVAVEKREMGTTTAALAAQAMKLKLKVEWLATMALTVASSGQETPTLERIRAPSHSLGSSQARACTGCTCKSCTSRCTAAYPRAVPRAAKESTEVAEVKRVALEGRAAETQAVAEADWAGRAAVLDEVVPD